MNSLPTEKPERTLSPRQLSAKAIRAAEKKRRFDRGLAAKEYKKSVAVNGVVKCEACSWHAPEVLSLCGTKSGMLSHCVDAHHIVPVSCGGSDDFYNIVALCPNCHAIADILSMRAFNEHGTDKYGILKKEKMIEVLRSLQCAQSFPDVVIPDRIESQDKDIEVLKRIAHSRFTALRTPT